MMTQEEILNYDNIETIGEQGSDPILYAGNLLSFRGYVVSLPTSTAGCIYDLIIDQNSVLSRVCVRAGSTRSGDQPWVIDLRRKKKNKVILPQSSECEFYFLIDGSLQCFLIPSKVIENKTSIMLGDKYANYRIKSMSLIEQFEDLKNAYKEVTGNEWRPDNIFDPNPNGETTNERTRLHRKLVVIREELRKQFG